MKEKYKKFRRDFYILTETYQKLSKIKKDFPVKFRSRSQIVNYAIEELYKQLYPEKTKSQKLLP